MADKHQRAAPRAEFTFQPFDGGEIEMVGRFIQQQDVGRGGQHLRQRRAPALAAGKMRGIFLAGQAELFDQIAGLIGIVAGAQPRLDISQRGFEAGEVRLLRQISHGGAGLHEAAAAVGRHEAGRDLQERGLAGAVAADQAEPFGF